MPAPLMPPQSGEEIGITNPPLRGGGNRGAEAMVKRSRRNDLCSQLKMKGFIAIVLLSVTALAIGDFGKTKRAEAVCYGPAMPTHPICTIVQPPHLNQ